MDQSKNLYRIPSGDENRESPEANSGSVDADGVDDTNDKSATSSMPIAFDGIAQRDAAIKVRGSEGENLSPGDSAFDPDLGEPQTEESPDVLSGVLPLWVARVNLLAVCGLVIFASALCLFLFTQTAILVREISSWVGGAKHIGFASLGLLWLAVLVASIQLLRQFLKLKQSPSFSLTGLGDLKKRREERAKSIANEKFAEETLREVLENYPCDDDHLAFLNRAVSGDGSILLKHRTELLNFRNGVTHQWLEKSRKQFFEPLDDAADSIIRQYGMKIGTGTAISPRGATDAFIVVAGLAKLAGDLCTLYSVRPGIVGIVILLGQTVLAAATAVGSDHAADQLEEKCGDVLSGAVGSLGSAVASKVSARAAEGTFNGLFVWRIGQRLKDQLTPLGN